MTVHLIKTKWAKPYPVVTLCGQTLRNIKSSHRQLLVDTPFTHSVDKANCKECLITKRSKIRMVLKKIDDKIKKAL